MCHICCIYRGILDVCLQYILCIYWAFWMFAYEILHIDVIQHVCLCNIISLYRGMLDVCLQYIHVIYTRAFFRFANIIMSSLFAFTWLFKMFFCVWNILCIYWGILQVCQRSILCIYAGVQDVCIWNIVFVDVCISSIVLQYMDF